MKIEKKSARFRPIFDFELKGKRSRAEPSQAENPSARALARASSARTHHYYLVTILKILPKMIARMMVVNMQRTRTNGASRNPCHSFDVSSCPPQF